MLQNTLCFIYDTLWVVPCVNIEKKIVAKLIHALLWSLDYACCCAEITTICSNSVIEGNTLPGVKILFYE